MTVCRSCLVKYLEENNTCPTCRIVIHQSHPLQYIGHDRTMQDIVYKLVPGLQEAEMRKQREFYHKLGMEVPGDIKGETCSAKQHLDSHRNGETKADDSSNKEAAEEKPEEDNDYHRSDEQVSICLECNSSKLRGLKRKWIRCSAQATVLHLKKFIAKKLNLSSFNEAVQKWTQERPAPGVAGEDCGGGGQGGEVDRLEMLSVAAVDSVVAPEDKPHPHPQSLQMGPCLEKDLCRYN
ncbi:polycomb group RING finger protein 3 isoform X3 [Pan troglodytes]|uniref:polycomb group RING finger protein 3 isoform X3 n=1 Tax=Pan troglodytes TaxID=9598 RepID=UPI000D0A003E|nr:polycomb group RING finger protein 3 isoform X4 [Pan troglodytes]XP_024211670.1 polycomb group RING finger protein 3 isoform X4 [Pan troglodytes]